MKLEVDGLSIPRKLLELVRARRWPADADAERAQNRVPLASRERVQAVTHGSEESIFLYCPQSFRRVASATNELDLFWRRPEAAPTGIDFERSIVIGDFGLGSDAPIILDYRASVTAPTVLRLHWSPNGNRWVEMAADVETLVNVLGL
jgi:hypothetical protein